jgi:hypothetical protein
MNYSMMTIGQLERAMMDAEAKGLTAVAITIQAHLDNERYPFGS